MAYPNPSCKCGPDSIATLCCPTPIPSILHATITSCDPATCQCVNLTIELTYIGTIPYGSGMFRDMWEGSGTISSCGSLPDRSATVTWYCLWLDGTTPVAEGPPKVDFSIGGVAEAGLEPDPATFSCSPVYWMCEHGTVNAEWCGVTEGDCGHSPCPSCIKVVVTE